MTGRAAFLGRIRSEMGKVAGLAPATLAPRPSHPRELADALRRELIERWPATLERFCLEFERVAGVYHRVATADDVPDVIATIAHDGRRARRSPGIRRRSGPTGARRCRRAAWRRSSCRRRVWRRPPSARPYATSSPAPILASPASIWPSPRPGRWYCSRAGGVRARPRCPGVSRRVFDRAALSSRWRRSEVPRGLARRRARGVTRRRDQRHHGSTARRTSSSPSRVASTAPGGPRDLRGGGDPWMTDTSRPTKWRP